MSARAECVMLNKGPNLLAGVAALDRPRPRSTSGKFKPFSGLSLRPFVRPSSKRATRPSSDCRMILPRNFPSSSETRSPTFSRPKISGMVQPVLNPEYANAGSCRKSSSSPTSRRSRSRRVVTSKVRTFGPAISIRMQIRRPSFCSAVRACASMCAQTFLSS